MRNGQRGNRTPGILRVKQALYQAELAAQTDGPGRDRTGYLLLAKQALSQVSYRPNKIVPRESPEGIEPPRHGLGDRRSSAELRGLGS